MTHEHTLDTVSLEAKYERFVNGKFKSMPSAKEDLLHAVMGIAGESGEVLDAIKKHYFYNKPLDLENVIEELGDIEFYLQAMRMCLSLDRKDILIANMVKLSKRYGSGSYSDAQAQARADKQIPQDTKITGRNADLIIVDDHLNETFHKLDAVLCSTYKD